MDPVQVQLGLKTPILLQPQLGVDNNCENMIECMNSGFTSYFDGKR